MARDADCLPGGQPMPNPVKHALVTLATYYPQIWPSQERLARDMCVTRANVNRRLRVLVDAGLVTRSLRGNRSTLYRLNLGAIRECVATDTPDCIGSAQEPVSPPIQEVQIRGDDDEYIPF